MPSLESVQQQQQRVDRSTSPLPQKAAASNPVQELKALFAEPAKPAQPTAQQQQQARDRTHFSDFPFEAIQCLQATQEPEKCEMPERGSWGSKVGRGVRAGACA